MLAALPLSRRPAPDPASVYVETLSSHHSRRTLGGSLEVVGRLVLGLPAGLPVDLSAVPWAQLTRAHVAELRSALAGAYQPATANRHLAALKGCLRECWRLGLLDSDQLAHALDAAKVVKGTRLPKGRHLDEGEIDAIARACSKDKTPAGARDGALLALLCSGGLRRAEPFALDLADYDPRAGSLRVRGKGNKERLVIIANGAKAALDDWIAVRGSEAGPLLCQVRRGGHVALGRLSSQVAYRVVAARAAEAGIKDCTPHDLRRTLIGRMLDNGADLSTVQKLAGHASPVTTAGYDRRDERAIAHQAQRIHFFWRSRSPVASSAARAG